MSLDGYNKSGIKKMLISLPGIPSILSSAVGAIFLSFAPLVGFAGEATFDPKKIVPPFLGFHCKGSTVSKLTGLTKPYDEFLLIHEGGEFALKYYSPTSFSALEGAWSVKPHKVSGMGIRTIEGSEVSTIFSFSMNRRSGVFEEEYQRLNGSQVLKDESSAGTCKLTAAFE
jgi:hypothetical protein